LALRTYRRAWRGAPVLARFAAMPFLLLLIVEGGFRHAAHISETWIDVTILDSLMSVLSAAIVTPVSVAAYRLFLFGRQVVRADAVDEFPTGTLQVLALSVAFAVALLPLGDMLTLMRHETAMMPSVALAYHAFVIVGGIAAAVVAIRTLFLFNQAVLGRDLNISLAWRQTAGNGWRTLGLMVFAALPAAVVAWPAGTFLLQPLGDVIDFETWQAWLGLVLLVLGRVLLAVLSAGAATLAFGHLTGFPLSSERRDAPVQPPLPLDVP
jgi:hypothetical protein